MYKRQLNNVVRSVVVVYALKSTAPTAVVTNSVVAICVVFVLAAAVGAAGVPVKVGLAIGAFPAKEVVIVPAKSASSFNDAAISFKVSKAVGAASTKLVIAVVTYSVLAI